eukprot:6139835-Heterocapsa_arctica.AAC.1
MGSRAEWRRSLRRFTRRAWCRSSAMRCAGRLQRVLRGGGLQRVLRRRPLRRAGGLRALAMRGLVTGGIGDGAGEMCPTERVGEVCAADRSPYSQIKLGMGPKRAERAPAGRADLQVARAPRGTEGRCAAGDRASP